MIISMLKTKMQAIGMSKKEKNEFMKHLSHSEANRVLDELLVMKTNQENKILD